jgi:hypothetical protein
MVKARGSLWSCITNLFGDRVSFGISQNLLFANCDAREENVFFPLNGIPSLHF